MKQRLIGAVGVMAVTTIMLVSGGWVMVTGLLALSIGGLYELYHAMRSDPDKQSSSGSENDAFWTMFITGILATVAWFVMIVFFRDGIMNQNLMLMYLLGLMMVMMMETVFLFPRFTFLDTAVTLLGIFAISMLFSTFYLIRTSQYGKFYVWYIFAVAWGSDVCAYFTGMSIGKHKLTPRLSPKKTIEGAVGGVVGSIVLCTILGVSMARVMLEDQGVMLRFSLVIGLVGGVFAELGDLFASSIKRVMNMKDFGNLIPGHGGILDRFDSTLMVAPIVMLMLNLFNMV
ncbi:MAG: phosphatidate cytidylyltransferase [Lachnospiraceae bacterium]|nr:phosphatidate cytidylyltransferase [Lachnospiraceae bacterium]